MSKCRSCGNEILWITMKTGRKMPVEQKEEARLLAELANILSAGKKQ